jgi:hypothetical protein
LRVSRFDRSFFPFEMIRAKRGLDHLSRFQYRASSLITILSLVDNISGMGLEVVYTTANVQIEAFQLVPETIKRSSTPPPQPQLARNHFSTRDNVIFINIISSAAKELTPTAGKSRKRPAPPSSPSLDVKKGSKYWAGAYQKRSKSKLTTSFDVMLNS